MREGQSKAVAIQGPVYRERDRLAWPWGRIAFFSTLLLTGILVLKVSLSFNLQETRYSLEQARDLHRQLKDELSELQYQRQTLSAKLFSDSTAKKSAMTTMALQPLAEQDLLVLHD